MIKDLLKTMTEINNDTNLNPSEKVLLSSLILYHNNSMGYSFPTYDNLKTALSTKRNETVSKYIKSLVDKGYITIKKIRGNKSTYYITKYLFYVEGDKKESVKPVDSNGKTPLDNQVHIDEVIGLEDTKVIEISNHTGLNKKESAELLAESGHNIAKVINAFEYVKKQKNVDDNLKYMKWAINNEHKIKVDVKNPGKEKQALKFNNFESREYDYDSLEKRLLGWGDEKENNKSLAEYLINN